ncbi:MAG: High-affinity nickel transporter [Planctomycetes bacterium]|nr:High-affinity nickel transporter [Planctomycetota bacterium]
MWPLALGLLAGAQHAVAGPDHLAGVAPFAAGRGGSGWRVGAAWGLGHAAGAAAAAAVALLLRKTVPGLEQQISSFSEVLVGVVLCLVGALGLRAACTGRAAPHRHGALAHAHPHLGAHAHAPFWLGCLHGVAGLSHLFAVLPALAFPGLLLPALYLGGYGLGSLAALMLFAGLLGRLPAGSLRALRLSLGTASAASLAVGLAWLGLSA